MVEKTRGTDHLGWLKNDAKPDQQRTIFADALDKFFSSADGDRQFLLDLKFGIDPVTRQPDLRSLNNHLAALEGYLLAAGINLQNSPSTGAFPNKEIVAAYALYSYLKVEPVAEDKDEDGEKVAAQVEETRASLDLSAFNPGPDSVSSPAGKTGDDLEADFTLNSRREIYEEEKNLPALIEEVAAVLREQFAAMNKILGDGLTRLEVWRRETNSSRRKVASRYRDGLEALADEQLTDLKYEFLLLAAAKAMEVLNQLRDFWRLLTEQTEQDSYSTVGKMPPAPNFASLLGEFAAYADSQNANGFRRVLATGNGDGSRSEIIASWRKFQDLAVQVLGVKEWGESAFAGYDRQLMADYGLPRRKAKQEQKKLNRALDKIQAIAERFDGNTQPFLTAWEKFITASPLTGAALPPSSFGRRTLMATVAAVIFGWGAEVVYQQVNQPVFPSGTANRKISGLPSDRQVSPPLPPRVILVKKPVIVPPTVESSASPARPETPLETPLKETVIVIAAGDSFLAALRKQALEALNALSEGERKNQLSEKFTKAYAAVNDDEIGNLNDYLKKFNKDSDIRVVSPGQKIKVVFAENETEMSELLQILAEILRARVNKL